MIRHVRTALHSFWATSVIIWSVIGVGYALLDIAESRKPYGRERGVAELSAAELRGLRTLTPNRFHLQLGAAGEKAYRSELGLAGARFAIASTSLSDDVLCALDTDGHEHLMFANQRIYSSRARGGRTIITTLHPIPNNPVPGLCTTAVEQAYEQARINAGLAAAPAGEPTPAR